MHTGGCAQARMVLSGICCLDLKERRSLCCQVSQEEPLYREFGLPGVQRLLLLGRRRRLYFSFPFLYKEAVLGVYCITGF